MPFKVIIAGSRNLNDINLVWRACNHILSDIKDLEIVSGGATGADELGETYAIQNKIPVKRFPANWSKYGKSAGYRRNEQMAKYSDMSIVFWDKFSRGSKHMIDLSKTYGLPTHVIYFGDHVGYEITNVKDIEVIDPISVSDELDKD